MENKEWCISAYAPDGVPTSDHLKLRSVSLPIDDSMPDHHVAVQILWLSIDPFLRILMAGRADDGLYLPQFQLDQVIRSGGIGKVIKSTDSKYKVGDIVKHSFLPVAQYCVLPSDPSLKKIDPADGIPLPEYLSSLGLPGFTAWVGIKLLGEAKAGSTVFISAAAGAVGMFAGQLAKLQGCTVMLQAQESVKGEKNWPANKKRNGDGEMRKGINEKGNLRNEHDCLKKIVAEGRVEAHVTPAQANDIKMGLMRNDLSSATQAEEIRVVSEKLPPI